LTTNSSFFVWGKFGVKFENYLFDFEVSLVHSMLGL